MTGVLGVLALLVGIVLIGTLLAGFNDAIVVTSRRIRRWWNA